MGKARIFRMFFLWSTLLCSLFALIAGSSWSDPPLPQVVGQAKDKQSEKSRILLKHNTFQKDEMWYWMRLFPSGIANNMLSEICWWSIEFWMVHYWPTRHTTLLLRFPYRVVCCITFATKNRGSPNSTCLLAPVTLNIGVEICLNRVNHKELWALLPEQ